MPDEQREAWDRQPDEGAKAFAAFCIYRDQPPTRRSLLQVSRDYYKRPDASRPGGRICEWSRAFNWVERATMRDAWLEDLRRAAEAKAEQERAEAWAARRIEIREEGWALYQELIERAREILALPLTQRREQTVEISEDGETIVKNILTEPLGVRARDAALIGKTAVDIGRLAAGLETARGLVDLDLSKLSEDELRKLASGRPFAGA